MQLRLATLADLPQCIALLADDELGATRENPTLPLDERYLAAFNAIHNADNNELVVMAQDDEIIGMLQLTFIPQLSHLGSWRAHIEGVRIASTHRGQGLGRQLFEWAINRAKQKRCRLVQLTSNKKRTDAVRFYESLGFVASHDGFKLAI